MVVLLTWTRPRPGRSGWWWRIIHVLIHVRSEWLVLVSSLKSVWFFLFSYRCRFLVFVYTTLFTNRGWWSVCSSTGGFCQNRRFLNKLRERCVVWHPEVRSLTLDRSLWICCCSNCVGIRCRSWRGRRRRRNESSGLAIWKRFLCFNTLDLLFKGPHGASSRWRKVFALTIDTTKSLWVALTAIMAFASAFPTFQLFFAELFGVSKLLTLEAAQRIWDVPFNFNEIVPNSEFLGGSWHAERYKISVSLYFFAIFFQNETGNILNSLVCHLSNNFSFRHFKQIAAIIPYHSLWCIKGAMCSCLYLGVK